MKRRKKKTTLKITTIYEPQVKQTHFCVGFYRLSREKSVKSMCYLKNYITVYLMH